jgi:hypothetical protein
VDAQGNPLAFDQRGAPFQRAVGGNADIGAYEVQIISLSPTTLPAGVYGSTYTPTTLTATELGYQGAFTFAVSAGALPPGLSLASDGTLSGTPTAAGSFSFTVTASDSGVGTGSQAYTLSVQQLTPAVTVNPVTFVYGTALVNFQLSGTATAVVNGQTVSVPGTFAYVSPGTVLNAGNNQVEAVTFTPSDTTDYTPVSASVTLTVRKATLTVSATNVTRPFGAANPTLTYSLSGFVNHDYASVVSGTATLTTSATASSPPGTYAIVAAAGTLSAANYTFTMHHGTLTVTPAPVSAGIFTWTGVNSANWFSAINWSTVAVPGPTATVIIQSAPFLPTLGANATVGGQVRGEG